MSLDLATSANMLNLCRLCGTETISQDELIHIFDTNSIALNIKSKIANCLGFEVSENDYLPKVLCAECVDNLEKFDEFKVKSNKTKLLFENLLKISIDNANQYENNERTSLNYNTFELNKNEMCVDDKLSDIKPRLPLEMTTQMSDMEPHYLPLELCYDKNVSRNLKKGIMFSQSNTYNIKVSNYKKSTKCIKNNDYKRKYVKKVKSDSTKNSEKKNTPKEFICEHCLKVFDTKKKIHSHMYKHSTIKYKCTICKKDFKYEKTLRLHMKLHNNEFDYICNYCGKGFVEISRLHSHIRALHLKERIFNCTKCNKKFTLKGMLKSHYVNVHSDDCSFICEICNKSFKSKSYLQNHKKSHKPKEARIKFKCNLCNALYVSRRGLQHHMLVHTGELKYGCEQCDKRYNGKPSLQIHMLTHTGEKSHVCDVCGKAFALNCNLLDHYRIHTGERPFKCNICEKSFNQRSSLNRHKKSCSKNISDVVL